MPTMQRLMAALAAVGLTTIFATAGEPDLAFGLQHDAIGAAILTATEDEVTITGIGSTGDDGVAISLGDAAGWLGAMDFGPAGALAPAARVGIQSTFANGGVRAIAGITIEETGGGDASVRLDTAGCATCAIVIELRLNGAVTDDVALANGYTGLIAAGAIGSSGEVPVTVRADRTTDGGGGVAGAMIVGLAEATPITLVGSVPVLADEIRVRLLGAPDAMTTQHVVEITAANVGSLTILDEALIQFGSAHRARGDAAISGAVDENGAPDVSVTNVSFDAENEIRVVPPPDVASPIEAVDLRLALPASDPLVFFLFRKSFARFGDGTTAEIANSSFLLGACGCAYAYYVADPHPDPAVTKTVIARLGGAIVDTGTPPGDLMWLVGIDAHPETWTVELDPNVAPDAFAYRETWRWDAPSLVTVQSGSGDQVLADEVEVLVETTVGPNGLPEALDEVRLDASALFDVCAFAIDDVVFRPGADGCPADITEDATVGFADLAALLAAWGRCAGCRADLNGDGTVGFADLTGLLEAWGACAE